TLKGGGEEPRLGNAHFLPGLVYADTIQEYMYRPGGKSMTTGTGHGSPQLRQGVEEVTRDLAAPFEPTEVKVKPAVVTGSRAMALAYVDARVIQDRLDEVLGVDGWQDDYECRDDGAVVCRLRLRLGGEWVTKVDVGGPSEQPDGGDRLKAAFSDALKRAAVKFGIGRYLYRLPTQWLDWDPGKRRFLKTPTLPPEARPAGAGAAGVGISPDQWAQRKAALKDRGISERKLLAHFQVGKPRELPAVRFAEVLALIRAPESVLLKK